MIKDYDNDIAMAVLGRQSARYRAIKKGREALRDSAVQLGLSNDIQAIEKFQSEINVAVAAIIEAMRLEP